MYRREFPGAAGLRFSIALFPDGGIPEIDDGVHYPILINEPESALSTEFRKLKALFEPGFSGLLHVGFWGAPIGSPAVRAHQSQDTAVRKFFSRG